MTKDNKYVIIEVDGYKATCNVDCLDDIEVLPLIDELTKGERMGAVNDLLNIILGKDGYKSYTSYFRDKYGRTPISTAIELINKAQSKIDPKD